MLPIQAETPPLREDADGGLRVGDTRVLLETLIHAFQNGASPEAIAQQYDTVALGDVYAVIAYYLRHRSEVERYLGLRERQGDGVQQQIAARQGDLSDIRQRLLRRRSA